MEDKFKELIAPYCKIDTNEITNDMSIRNDLGLSSLDMMTFLGDLEDEFDVEFDFDNGGQQIAGINTVEDAINLLKENIE